MNSKLKKLEELEKLLPLEPCAHSWLLIKHDEESAREVEKTLQEIEGCLKCRRNGAKPLVIDITAQHLEETHKVSNPGGSQIILK